MCFKVKDLIHLLDVIAPFSLAEPWDNCGLQAGDPSWPVKKILVALDASMAAMQYAETIGADLLITHHPLIMTAQKSMDFSKMPGSAVAMAAQNRISILAAHTNLDKAAGGLNDYFSERMGLKSLRSLVPEEPHGCCDGQRETGEERSNILDPVGIGRIGALEPSMPLKHVAKIVKERFGVSWIRLVGDPDLEVREVAVCTGSGGSLLNAFFSSRADLYITGDIKYHEARDVEASGRGLVDLGHFASERIAVTLLENRLKQCLDTKGFSVDVVAFQDEKDPFSIL